MNPSSRKEDTNKIRRRARKSNAVTHSKRVLSRKTKSTKRARIKRIKCGVIFFSGISILFVVLLRLSHSITSSFTELSSDDGNTTRYHLVFSTSCSKNDWQSYLFFYLAMAIQQSGEVTHIVSGCDPQKQAAMEKRHHEQHTKAMNTNFKIHFTPDFSVKEKFETTKYWNKPFGVKHWMEHRFGYSWDTENDSILSESNDYDDDVIILIDPDMLMLRSFKNNFTSHPKTLWTKFFQERPDELFYNVKQGQVMASEYGFGDRWLYALLDDGKNLTHVLGTTESPVYTIDRAEASNRYPGGPPYMATARDFYKIVRYWTHFLPRYFEEKPSMMNEMYSYCLAAAHLGIKHQLARGFMISDVTGDEGWDFLQEPWNDGANDQDFLEQACNLDAFSNLDSMPQVLHFCQRYGIGEFFISKYKVPKRSFTCEFPLYEEPSMDIAKNLYAHMGDFSKQTYDANNPKDTSYRARNTYMVCSLYRALNKAATFYKDHHCPDGNANYEKSWQYFKVYDTDPSGPGQNGLSKSKK